MQVRKQECSEEFQIGKFTWNTRIRKREVNKTEWEWKKLKSPEKYELLIKLRVRINDKKNIERVYDTGANASFINQKIID